MNQNPTTVIYVDNYERLHFFLKIARSIDHQVMMITNKLSVYQQIPKQYKKYLIRSVKDNSSSSQKPIDSLKTLSVVAGYHTQTQAKKIYQEVTSFLFDLYSNNKFEHVFVWNGSTTFGWALRDFCIKHSIKTTFFEIANFPSKLFVDKQGVNAQSSLYDHPEILDHLEINEQAYDEWLDEYKSDKKNIVKQAKNRSKIKYKMLLDYFGYCCMGVVREDFRNPLVIIKNKLSNRIQNRYEEVNLDEPYIFFPLQVSNDSQILLNSDYNNQDVIRDLIHKYKDKRILLKVHPAEPSKAFIHEILTLIKDYPNVKLVGNNTKDLIQNAQKVVIINSTVGLEALLLKKDVEIYGRAIYEHFNEYRLKAYIQKYLINIDYFNDEIHIDEVRRLIE